MAHDTLAPRAMLVPNRQPTTVAELLTLSDMSYSVASLFQ